MKDSFRYTFVGITNQHLSFQLDEETHHLTTPYRLDDKLEMEIEYCITHL